MDYDSDNSLIVSGILLTGIFILGYTLGALELMHFIVLVPIWIGSIIDIYRYLERRYKIKRIIEDIKRKIKSKEEKTNGRNKRLGGTEVHITE